MINGATAGALLSHPAHREQGGWLVHRFAYVEKMTSTRGRPTIPTLVPKPTRRLPTSCPSVLHSWQTCWRGRIKRSSRTLLLSLPTGSIFQYLTLRADWLVLCR